MRSLRKSENNQYVINTAIRELQLIVAAMAGGTIDSTTTNTFTTNVTNIINNILGTTSGTTSLTGNITSDQANKLITELKVIATLIQIGLNIKDEIQPIRESIEDDDLTVST